MTTVLLVRPVMMHQPQVLPSFRRTRRPISVVMKPAPPLMPLTEEAVRVMPLPVAAEGVSVVAVVFSSR